MAELKADVYGYLPNRRPILVYLFLLVCVLVYLRFPGWIFFRRSPLPVGFMTAIFVHANLFHLLLNGLALWWFGRDMERLFGHGRFLAIFLLAGIGGNLLSYLVRSTSFDWARVSVGASGAIFGVMAMHLVYFWRYELDLGDHGNQRLLFAIAILVVNIVQGFGRQGIDNLAHIGGAVTGTILAYYFLPRYDLIPATEAERWLDRTKPRDYLKPLAITILFFILLTLAPALCAGLSSLSLIPAAHMNRIVSLE
jgi:rhomboid protease GluP